MEDILRQFLEKKHGVLFPTLCSIGSKIKKLEILAGVAKQVRDPRVLTQLYVEGHLKGRRHQLEIQSNHMVAGRILTPKEYVCQQPECSEIIELVMPWRGPKIQATKATDKRRWLLNSFASADIMIGELAQWPILHPTWDKHEIGYTCAVCGIKSDEIQKFFAGQRQLLEQIMNGYRRAWHS